MPARPGIYRAVFSVMLDHPDYQVLSEPARHVLLALRLSDECGIACLFQCWPEQVAKRTALTIAQVRAALEELSLKPHARRPWIVRHGDWVWIRNGVLHDPGRPLTDRKRVAGICRVVAACPHETLR